MSEKPHLSEEVTAIEQTTDPAEMPQDELLNEEIFEEELIIEDFTIDGICGVY
ncbi:MAG: mycofactocin precursor [Ktedonobacteraceae bacterium]|nr:mycofactocin precursor [Ktedonobacteraceae bacterium]MBO0792308.1 mycofactocin precursor [Ktedonobacteraceae bacterium]